MTRSMAFVALLTGAACALPARAAVAQPPLASGVVTAFGASLTVAAGTGGDAGFIRIPPCAAGERFLIQSVAGAPDTRSMVSPSLPLWAVTAYAYQWMTSPDSGRVYGLSIPLVAYGRDLQHAEARFPGGFASLGSQINYAVSYRGSHASAVRFYLQFSGACGKGSVIP